MGEELPPYIPPPPDPSIDLSWLPPDLQPGADLGDPDRPNWQRDRIEGSYGGKPEGVTWGDFALVPGKPITPGHRRICQLFAMGLSNKEVAEEVGFTEPRIATLRSNTLMVREIARLQEKVFEETIQDRMKGLGTSALDVLESAVRDETKQFKSSERLSAAQWLIEKLDGKAAQKHDIGENLLGVLMDRLDARKTEAPKQIEQRDVSDIETAVKEVERDPLADWIDDFSSGSSR